MQRVFSTLLVFAIVALTGCPSSSDSPKSDAAGAGSTGVDAKSHSLDSGADAESEDEVRPVYDTGPNAPIDPVAKRFCAALSDIPEKNRSSCCSKPPSLVVAAECERMLSAAVIAKAVTIANADVDACAAALEKTYAGCDWVGPFPPDAPVECTSIVKGTLASGARCRSSLECTGELRCNGLTPTHAGKCSARRPDGDLCGGAVDSLAAFARQSSTPHKECEHQCINHKCRAQSSDGGECAITPDCNDGLQCIQKKCKAGAPAKLGETCPGGQCEAPAQCILGKCALKKASGEACTQDFECKGGCLRADGGTKGKCGTRCDIR